MFNIKSSCESLWGLTVDDHLGMAITLNQCLHALDNVEGVSYREAALFLSDVRFCLTTINIYEALESNPSASQRDEIIKRMNKIKGPVKHFFYKVDSLTSAFEAVMPKVGPNISTMRRRGVKQEYRRLMEQTSLLKRKIEADVLVLKGLVHQPAEYVYPLFFSSHTRIILLCDYSAG
jgi:hypothetical protein